MPRSSLSVPLFVEWRALHVHSIPVYINIAVWTQWDSRWNNEQLFSIWCGFESTDRFQIGCDVSWVQISFVQQRRDTRVLSADGTTPRCNRWRETALVDWCCPPYSRHFYIKLFGHYLDFTTTCQRYITRANQCSRFWKMLFEIIALRQWIEGRNKSM